MLVIQLSVKEPPVKSGSAKHAPSVAILALVRVAGGRSFEVRYTQLEEWDHRDRMAVNSFEVYCHIVTTDQAPKVGQTRSQNHAF